MRSGGVLAPEEIPHFLGGFHGQQLLAGADVAHQPGDLGQQMQVLVGAMFRRHRQEKNAGGLSVRWNRNPIITYKIQMKNSRNDTLAINP